MRAAFILNSNMRAKDRFLKALEQTSANFPQISTQCLETKYHNHAQALAMQAVQQSANCIIAVGGDGTLNQVLNGVLSADKNQQVIVGLLPMGSGNDFARSIGTTQNLYTLFELIQSKQSTPVDIGKVSFKDLEDKDQTRYFINIADIGMGAEVVMRVNASSKKLGAQFTFMKAILQTFLSFKHKDLKVMSEEWQWEGKAMSIAIANGKYFGGGLGIAPDADIQDGKFQVTVLGEVSLWDYILHIPHLKKLLHIEHKHVKYFSTKSLNIFSNDAPCGLEADGEFLGYLPAKIEVLEKQVDFLTENKVLQ